MILVLEILFALAFLIEGFRLRSRRVGLTGLGLAGIAAVEVAIMAAHLSRGKPFPEIPLYSLILALAAIWLVGRGWAATRQARALRSKE